MLLKLLVFSVCRLKISAFTLGPNGLFLLAHLLPHQLKMTTLTFILILTGADVNRLHGTLLPLQCACMVSDSLVLRLLLRKGAKVLILS
jgi:hypothetical protein